MTEGWPESAEAWVASLGERGDFGRVFVLDGPMLERVRGRGFARALDVGCGEGRFCRMLAELGIRAVGIDPTRALLEEARRRDPGGDYRSGRAEQLAFPDAAFDLVVSYLTLIDIPDAAAAIAEMTRVLRPGGTLLIANLNSFSTAGLPDSWQPDASGQLRYAIDNYLEERAIWVSWRGIRIRNWHRPLSTYMGLLIENGLTLKHFAEPAPHGGPTETADRYRRVPYFHIMEWEKPTA
ncbi:Methyltransferase domain [Chelatococcus sambhunathii]|nr:MULTISPECIES: class I SAM-dependent methyltransferase [Chelatococcus]CUA86137.1 Methyltransferase domain [Chelatococcus sambhunathii]